MSSTYTDDLETNTIFNTVTETSQICLRFAEEVRTLRSELLELKEDKRSWLVANQALQKEIKSKNDTINALKLELLEVTENNIFQRRELRTKEDIVHTTQILNERTSATVRALESHLETERKRNSTLSRELEQSLRDELAVRSRCSELESGRRTMAEAARKHSTQITEQNELLAELRDKGALQEGTLKAVEKQLRSLLAEVLQVEESDEAAERLTSHQSVPLGSCEKVLQLVKAASRASRRQHARLAQTRKYMLRLMEVVQQQDETSLLPSCVLPEHCPNTSCRGGCVDSSYLSGGSCSRGDMGV